MAIEYENICDKENSEETARTGKMVHWLRILVVKHEEQSSDPSIHVTSWAWSFICL